MLRTIGWLILMWCGLGCISLIFYMIGSIIVVGFRLHHEGDEEGTDILFDEVTDEVLKKYLIGLSEWVADHPRWNNTPIALLRWDVCAKVWITICYPQIREFYNERMQMMNK